MRRAATSAAFCVRGEDGCPRHELVMPGLVPGIHLLRAAAKAVDGRDKPGHDGEWRFVRADAS